MEFCEHNNVLGKFPEFGAIFMSNKATSKECFRRKLLGLPSGQGDFVKQVKAGMFLFLFEFERRELHGVFQACSDGAMNIVPHAYSSSGKQFPAQVKFIEIWQCDPLSENEFRDAIRENYFAPYKFNFGLSERQVRKLLLLFCKRKIKDRLLERQFTRSNVARSVGYSAKEAGSAANDGSFIMIDSKKDERKCHATFGSPMSTEYLVDSVSKCRREDDTYTSLTFRNGHKTDRALISNVQLADSSSKVEGLANDARVATSNMVGNDHDVDIEYRRDALTNQHGISFPTSRKSSDEVNFATSYGLGRELKLDNGFQLPSTEHTGVFQSNPPLHFSKPMLEENCLIGDHFQQFSATRNLVELQNSLYCSQLNLEAIKDQFRPSPTAHHSLEPQNSELSFSALDGDRMPMSNSFYSTFYGDGVVARNIPNDPDVPRFDNSCSSFLGLSNSVPEFLASHNSVFPSFDQSFPPYVEPEGTSNYPNINVSLSYYIPLSSANQHEQPNGPGMLFPGAIYPVHVARSSSMNENSRHNRSSSSFELYNSVPQRPPHDFFPPFVDESFPSCTEPKSTSKCQNLNSLLSSDNSFPCPDHHDYGNRASTLYHGAAYPQNVPRYSSGIEKTREDTSSYFCSHNRSSSFVSGSSHEERDYQLAQHENNRAFAASVPRLERMSTGHVHCHEKGSINIDTRENSERMYSDSPKRKSVFCRLALPSEVHRQDEHDIGSSVDELMTMLHKSHNQWMKEKKIKQRVKRHDEVTNSKNKKQMIANSQLLMDQLPKVSKEITVNDISAGKEDALQISEMIPFVDFQRHKKVQKNESDANTGSIENASLSGQQHKRRKLIRPKFSRNGSSGNVIVGSQDNASRMTQNVELPDMTFCSGLEDKNIGLNEGNEKVASCVVAPCNADGDSKEALQHVGLVSIEYKSNTENSSTLMNSEVELDRDEGDGNFSDNVKAENKSCHDGGNENSSKNVEVENRSFPTRDERAIEIMVSSGNDYNCGPEKAFKEVGNGEKHLFLQSVGEQCKASIKTVSCFNMKESQELCEEYGKRGEIIINDISAGKEDGLQISEPIPFVDFQHHKKVQKIESDANTGSTENTSLSGLQHKRRKLIRPKFSGNGSSGNVIVGSQDDASRMTQYVKLQDMTFCSGLEDKNIGLNEGNEVVASFVVVPGNADGDSKEALQHVGLVSSEYKSNTENSSTLMNSEVDGIVSCELDHDGDNGNFSDNVKAENISCHDDGIGNLSKNVEVENRSCPTRDERAIEIMVSSGIDYNSGSKKAIKEVGNGEESKQHLFLQSVGEQCKTSIETVSCSNMKESQELCVEYDKRGGVMAAAAGKDRKVVYKGEDNGNENRVCLSHCEITMGQSQI